MAPALVQLLVVFAEPGFPPIDVPRDLIEIPGAVVATSVDKLDEALKPGRVLVWRHGSAFPADAWPALVRFLEQGGSFAYLGGEPFTRPVTGPPGHRVVQPRTVSLLKALRLNQCYRLDAGGAVQKQVGWTGLADRTLGPDAWVSILEPRFTDSKLFPGEDGSWGPREAILRPLSYIHCTGDDERFPCAAGSFAIDRLDGRFAGGRWVFRLVSEPPGKDELAFLLAQAGREATDLRVESQLGCYHVGEMPTVTVSLERPAAKTLSSSTATISMRLPDGQTADLASVSLSGRHHAREKLRSVDADEPGLYRVTATIEGAAPVETGFWVFDRALYESGDALSFDGYTLRRNGRPEPVIGTTVMSETVHRDFLFEPNAAIWDDTFAELASLDINLVRTGMWAGYRDFCNDDGSVHKRWLRALEAYYLSARRHGIPVLFTFFAFIPEAYGGTSPYFDPTSLEAQRAYFSSVASRFAGAKEMLWDLINEPSFASARKLWQCRPNEDEFEAEAFRRWLQRQYGTDTARDDWQDRVRARWRLLPDEPIGLPKDSDFNDRHLFGNVRPYRAREYVHFAQNAFAAWSADMSRAIREAGSTGGITVGQDEGGLYDRPAPLLHHHVLDFTSIHTWWANDELLWDGVMAKAPGTPLLAGETGVMGRELLSGASQRGDVARAELLSRKIAYAFAAGAFGAVQWCYEVNPYMDSDNEVAIGLKRVDGSYKPEHRVMRDYAAFVARNAERFELADDGAIASPEVVMVLPSADQFSPRGMQTTATRRVIRVVMEELGVPVQVVSEYRTRSDLGSPKLIILPSCRGISGSAWRDIMSAVVHGATLHCSGWFETDDANLPARRLGASPRTLCHVETLGEGASGVPSAVLRFPLDATQSWYAADHGEMPGVTSHGVGKIRHFALPIDWAIPSHVQRRLYAASLRTAGVGVDDPAPWQAHPGVLVRKIRMKDVDLVVAINETPVNRTIALTARDKSDAHAPTRGSVPARMANLFIVGHDGQLLDSMHATR